MVREAQKAGLEFDEVKLRTLNCGCDEEDDPMDDRRQTLVPTIEIDPVSPEPAAKTESPLQLNGSPNGSPTNTFVDEENFGDHHHTPADTEFHTKLHYAATQGRLHDVLQFNNGATRMSVVSWNIMEYLPFRRMDLKEDGSWHAITWPLPKGETRDIPSNAVIHSSVVKRMFADPKYRPGNLIVGGGGRGVRQAPKEMGIGKWACVREDGHAVGECFVRRFPPERKKTGDTIPSVVMPAGPQGNFFAGRKRSAV